MPTVPDPRFAPVGMEFLRGDHSVPDVAHAFRAVVNVVTTDRPLDGSEVEVFYALEEWEAAGWDDRPGLVNRLRLLTGHDGDSG